MHDDVIARLRAEARQISEQAFAAPAREAAVLAAGQPYYNEDHDAQMRADFYEGLQSRATTR